MGIQIDPHKIKNQSTNKKEWTVGFFKTPYILIYEVQGKGTIKENISAGTCIRGTLDTTGKYFIIKRANEGICHIPISAITIFRRCVEETVTTETVIIDTPI